MTFTNEVRRAQVGMVAGLMGKVMVDGAQSLRRCWETVEAKVLGRPDVLCEEARALVLEATAQLKRMSDEMDTIAARIEAQRRAE